MIPISVCIIMKNEEKHIGNCLAKLSEYPWEIVVTDTGSDDRSIEIARQYTTSVYSFEWIDDFSAAKNFCVSKAHNSQVLCLDADEYLDDVDPNIIYSEMKNNPRSVGQVLCRSVDNKGNTVEVWLARAFNREIYKFCNPIHEQIMPIKEYQKAEYYNLSASFLHVGYQISKEEMEFKQERNLRLLLSYYSDHDDKYTAYQIGKSYEALGKVEQAKTYYEKALKDGLFGNEELSQHLVIGYGYVLEKLGMNNEAISFLSGIEAEFSFLADYHFLMGYLYAGVGRNIDAMVSYIRATSCNVFHTRGTDSYLAWYNIAVLYLKLGMKKDAVDFLLRCNDYEPAIELLTKLRE